MCIEGTRAGLYTDKNIPHMVFDINLPPANRTEANMWKLQCLEYIKELSNANKGLRRLNKKNKWLKESINILIERYAGKILIEGTEK